MPSCIFLLISFEKFSDTYYKALYLCRNSDYKKTSQEISIHIKELLEIFEHELANSTAQISAICKYIDENCTSSNFSVTLLADYFDVSASYMSYLFKKEMNINLTDYVWNLRFNIAADLLLNTDLSIEEISTQVGYDNSSSFRRKFKEATQFSPSQYRKSIENSV